MPRVVGFFPKMKKHRENLKWLKGTANQSSICQLCLNRRQLRFNKLPSKYLHMVLLLHSRKDPFGGSWCTHAADTLECDLKGGPCRDLCAYRQLAAGSKNGTQKAPGTCFLLFVFLSLKDQALLSKTQRLLPSKENQATTRLRVWEIGTTLRSYLPEKHETLRSLTSF